MARLNELPAVAAVGGVLTVASVARARGLRFAVTFGDGDSGATPLRLFAATDRGECDSLDPADARVVASAPREVRARVFLLLSPKKSHVARACVCVCARACVRACVCVSKEEETRAHATLSIDRSIDRSLRSRLFKGDVYFLSLSLSRIIVKTLESSHSLSRMRDASAGFAAAVRDDVRRSAGAARERVRARQHVRRAPPRASVAPGGGRRRRRRPIRASVHESRREETYTFLDSIESPPHTRSCRVSFCRSRKTHRNDAEGVSQRKGARVACVVGNPAASAVRSRALSLSLSLSAQARRTVRRASRLCGLCCLRRATSARRTRARPA